jgi:nucleoside 2-deoxyribosyltransferase
VASPLGFTVAGKFYYNNVLLPELNKVVEVMDPWSMSNESFIAAMIKKGKNKELWNEVGYRNSQAIKDSHLLAAVLDGQEIDSGTASEIGYASALGLKCFGLRTDHRQTGEAGSPVNLQVNYFIEESGGSICYSLEQLLEELSSATENFS